MFPQKVDAVICWMVAVPWSRVVRSWELVAWIHFLAQAVRNIDGDVVCDGPMSWAHGTFMQSLWWFVIYAA